MPFPYGMNPSTTLVDNVLKDVQKIQNAAPETTCSHCTNCCKAGCPSMYFAEFVNIRRSYVDKLSKEDHLTLTLECVRRYLWNVVATQPKPCVFLGADSMCKVYDARHIKCRLYGVIPKVTYNRNAAAVAKEMKTPIEEMPLAKQCPFVKIKPKFNKAFPHNEIPEKTIKKWETKLRELDRRLGMPMDVQDEGYGFLTYHDWHLMFEMGKTWMESLTKLRTSLSDEQKEQFLTSLSDALSKKA